MQKGFREDIEKGKNIFISLDCKFTRQSMKNIIECLGHVVLSLPGSRHGDRGGRCVGLPHGHRLLGQEVRLHVGRRKQRYEWPQGHAGEIIIQYK